MKKTCYSGLTGINFSDKIILSKLLKGLKTVKNILEIKIEAIAQLRKVIQEIPFIEIEPTRLKFSLTELASSSTNSPDLTEIRIKTPDGPKVLVVEVKSNGQPRFARKAADQLERYTREVPGSYGIFMAPFISQNSAAILEERNIGYMDLAGNGKISFWPVYIKTVADRNPYAQKRDLRSLYSQKSIKTIMILRVLLNEPGRVWKTEELASESGSSLGQVSNVKKKLDDREWIQSVKGGIQLTEPVKLLTEWAENYRSSFNEFRDFYSMNSVQEIETDLVQYGNSREINYALTEFSGGARYAPAVRYQKVSAYIESDYLDRVATELSWKEVESGANIRLFVPSDKGYFYGTRNIEGATVASPVQVYLDLKNLRGRGEEAAEAIMKEVIAPKWQ